MSRSRLPRRTRQSPEIEALLQLAHSLEQSASRIEDAFWESRLAALIDKLLGRSDDESLNAALDALSQSAPRACDALADTIEYCVESHVDNSTLATSGDYDFLLFTAPLLVWSRYTIPSGQVPAEIMANLRTQLAAHIFAPEVKLGLFDVLFSPDQLPQDFSGTARFKDKLAKAAIHGRDAHIDAKQLGETINFLSDTRYLLGVAAVAKGAPLFHWQEDEPKPESRDTALARWRKQGGETLRPLLPACASELLLPQAFHSACRDADRQSRPYSVRASVAFLNTAVNIPANQLKAVVATFKEARTEEFRIGFLLKDGGDVVHGVVWPLLDAEDNQDSPTQIEAVLRECDIDDIRFIDHSFPLEYCDDCGVPLYPNDDDEAVHAELPEADGTQPSQHLH